jgi:sialic acid synthase SpsE
LKLKNYAKFLNIDFFATPFDVSSLEFLESINMPYYKIASADLRNPILQEKIAKTKKPIFLSTGGGTL